MLSRVVRHHLNGYDNQKRMQMVTAVDGSFCTMLENQGSPHVGNANVFVSW